MSSSGEDDVDDRKPPPAADIVKPVVDDARLGRAFEKVESALVERRGRRAWLRRGVPLAVAAGLLLVAVRYMRPATQPSSSGSASSGIPTVTPTTMTLAEASRVTPSVDARFTLESATRERVAIVLSAGALDIEASHLDGRPFTVVAVGHEVSVVGTRFRVWLAQANVLHVAVERGKVRVRGPNVDRFLTAGEMWESDRREGVDGFMDAAIAGAFVPAPSNSEALPPEPEPTSSSAKSSSGAAARELFARGLDARRVGKEREAAAAFDTFRKTYRSDPRAGLAAYELGRIRLDVLTDPSGAVEAFTDALALAPTGSFREDAEARRVDALDAMRDWKRCEDARAGYLTRYPSGLHVRRVTERCVVR